MIIDIRIIYVFIVGIKKIEKKNINIQEIKLKINLSKNRNYNLELE